MSSSRDVLRERVGNYRQSYSALYHRRTTAYDVRQVLGEFESFLAVRAKRTPRLRAVKQEDVTAYMSFKLEQGRAPATVNRHLRSVKAFLKWCVDRKFLKENPSKGVRPLKVVRRRPPIPTAEDVGRLIRRLEQDLDWLFCSLVLVAANTGLRLGELVHLRAKDVDLEERRLVVRNDEEHGTKDNAERSIPLNERAHRILAYWVHHAREEGWKTAFFAEAPKSLGWLWRALKRRCGLAGVRGINWYCLRHFFATSLAGQVPELVLAAIMGHSDPRTTRRWYIHNAHLAMKAPPVI